MTFQKLKMVEHSTHAMCYENGGTVDDLLVYKIRRQSLLTGC